MGVIIEFTKKGNIPLAVGTSTVYAMAIPLQAQPGLWGLFPDDRTWQERVAVNQEMLATAVVASGGLVVRDNKVIAKLLDLGDKWVHAEALAVVYRSMNPRPDGVVIDNREPS